MKTWYIALRSHDGSGWVSSLIAQGTYGEVNHSSIEFVNDGVVIEAHAKKGVTIRPSTGHGTGDLVHRFVFAVSKEEYDMAFAFAKAQVGKAYDKAAIVRFVPFLRNLVKSDREESGRWICSELAEVVLRKANLGTVRVGKVESVSPQKQFDSIRCDVKSSFGPIMYEVIDRGALRDTQYRA